MKYEYIGENEEQYDSTLFVEGKPVKARYRHAGNSFDHGNPFIEALPMPREGTDTVKSYTKTFKGQMSKSTSRANMLANVSLLKQVRFPLPFQQELEDECYTAIVSSYRERHIVGDKDVNLNFVRSDKEITTHQILVGNVASATEAGFHMLGYSGCGKSSALAILFANYPQYIVHVRPDGSRFPQITYLVVSCQPNSNFRALYESVGRSIDRALGNLTPVYEHEIKKANGLAGKADLIRRYIEQFAIGIIVFDEIQLIDFESTRENSFEGLMTLANQTKVAMAVVGTEDAYEKMFTKLRTSRRLGSEIRASAYCDDWNYFAVLVTHLFRYQWFEKKVKPTTSIINALYKYSAGIVDQLIGIYMYMTIDYLKANKKPEINEEYVRKTAEKHYPGIQLVLTDISNPMNDAKRTDIVRTANAELARIMDETSQEKFKSAITESFDDIAEEKERIDGVVQAITFFTDDYNTRTIERETESVLKTKQAASMTKKELARKVMQRLKNRASDKRPHAKKAPKMMDEKHIEMKKFLEN